MDDLFYKIALNLTPNIGGVRARLLLTHCGSVEAIFKTKVKQLSSIPGISPKIAKAIHEGLAFKQAEKERGFIEKEKIQALFFTDQAYPHRLAQQAEAPTLLYYKGKSSLNPHRSIAIVGTRQPSTYGKQNCTALIEDLVAYQPLVVSGLAYGVDGIAHKKCLEHNIPTVAVLGHGFKSIYPASHRDIAHRMIEKGGLLTEYPSHLGPEREHFPKRNRIVAALSDALVVVETGLKGGSMITAKFATDFKKHVFAFPGRLHDPMSKGCNHLIKNNYAQLLESAKDIAHVCKWSTQTVTKSRVQSRLFSSLTEDQQELIQLLRQQEKIAIDQLKLAMPYGQGRLTTILLELELNGLIRELPGKHYCLVH